MNEVNFLKALVLIFFLLFGTIHSANASQASAQNICVTLAQNIIQNNAKASTELLKNLKQQGRVSSNDLREYDRITEPARILVNQLIAICQDEKLDIEQAELLKKTLTN